MNGPEFLIPVTIFGGGFAMIFGIAYLRTRENLAMVERGMNPRQRFSRPLPFNSLRYGLLFLGAGIGLLLAYFIDFQLPNRVDSHGFSYRHDNPAIYLALVAAGGGLGLIISYFIEKKEWDKLNTTGNQHNDQMT